MAAEPNRANAATQAHFDAREGRTPGQLSPRPWRVRAHEYSPWVHVEDANGVIVAYGLRPEDAAAVVAWANGGDRG